MQKLVVFITILMFFSANVFGEEAEMITTEKAESLIIKMDDLYWLLQTTEHNGKEIDAGPYAVAYESVRPYSEYLKVAETVFIKEEVHRFLNLTKTFYCIDGKAVIVNFAPQFYRYHANGRELWLNGIAEEDFSYDVEVTDNGDGSANVEFNYVYLEHPYDNGAVIKRSSITVTSDNGKWGISGGEYIDMLEEYHSNLPTVFSEESPQTGTPIVLLLITAVAAFAVIIYKQKMV